MYYRYGKKTGLSKIISEHSIYGGAKVYLNQGFLDKIEINLANISSSPTDEFKLLRVYYYSGEFTCELCEHQHCLYAFEILNLKTEIVIKVGSECIHHFKDKGIDINLAEGLMKRVTRATDYARKEVIKKLGQETWNSLSEEEKGKIPFHKISDIIEEFGKESMKNLSREDKSRLTINAYMAVQAKELLMDVYINKHILDEKEINQIIDLGMEKELTEAKENQRKIMAKGLVSDIDSYFRNLFWKETDTLMLKNFYEKCKEFNLCEYLDKKIEVYNKRKNNRIEFSWLLDYKGNNSQLRRISNNLNILGEISIEEIDIVKNFEKEGENSIDFNKIISTLLTKNPGNTFYSSIKNYWDKHHCLSEKQQRCILKDYNNE